MDTKYNKNNTSVIQYMYRIIILLLFNMHQKVQDIEDEKANELVNGKEKKKEKDKEKEMENGHC